MQRQSNASVDWVSRKERVDSNASSEQNFGVKDRATHSSICLPSEDDSGGCCRCPGEVFDAGQRLWNNDTLRVWFDSQAGCPWNGKILDFDVVTVQTDYLRLCKNTNLLCQ